MTVETTITVSIPEEGMNLEALAAAMAQAVGRAGQELMVAACQRREKEVLARAGRALRRDKQRPLDLLTRFGWIRLKRWYTQERATGKYSYPLDKMLGLRLRQHASPWVGVNP